MPARFARGDRVRGSGAGLTSSPLDPLVERALWLLERRAERPTMEDRVERVAHSLLAADRGTHAEVDIGIWGEAVYRASAQKAAEVQRVAVSGDDLLNGE